MNNDINIEELDEILGMMNLTEFRLRNPKIIKNASLNDLADDILSNLPNFIFIYDKDLSKEYLFNLFAYLSYIGYPVYWYDENLPLNILQKALIFASANSSKTEQVKTLQNSHSVLFMYSGVNGKKAIAEQIFKIIADFKDLKLNTPHQENVRIVLDSTNVNKEDKWLFNFAGFLSYNKIPYSWYREDAENTVKDKYLFIGRTQGNAKFFIDITPNSTTESELEIKKRLFKDIQEKNILSFNANERVYSLVMSTFES